MASSWAAFSERHAMSGGQFIGDAQPVAHLRQVARRVTWASWKSKNGRAWSSRARKASAPWVRISESGSVPRRQFGNANEDAGVGEFTKRPPRRLDARTVGVKAEDGLVGELGKPAGVMGREGGAQRGDHVFDASLDARDEIELALADDGAPEFGDRAAARSRPKKMRPLLKSGVSGELRYLAIWSFCSRMRPLKAMTSDLFVADRKH